MRPNIIIGLIVIVIGLGFMVYNRFSDHIAVEKEEKTVNVGPFSGTFEKEKTVPKNMIVGGIIVVAGLVFLIMRGKK